MMTAKRSPITWYGERLTVADTLQEYTESSSRRSGAAQCYQHQAAPRRRSTSEVPDAMSTTLPSLPVSALDYALSLLRDGTLTIDDEGRIWRQADRLTHRRRSIPARRAENVGGKGYLRLTLWMPEGKLRSVQAHIVIWVWYGGLIPDGQEINHKDLDKRNNRLSNLELVTPSGNMLHAYAAGRARAYDLKAEWRGRPKLTPGQKQQMCQLRQQGMSVPEIAARFNRSAGYTFRVVRP